MRLPWRGRWRAAGRFSHEDFELDSVFLARDSCINRIAPAYNLVQDMYFLWINLGNIGDRWR